MYKLFIKRFLDILLSVCVLLVCSPIMLIVGISLFCLNNGKPFFKQARPGLNGKIFLIRKFKTMNDKRGRDGQFLPDQERITFLGSFIRKISIDELPQLFNVLMGDMSIIGPRPLLVSYLPLYNSFQSRRHEVKPGITGWAQVNGRNSIGWDEKFQLDIYYVNNHSFYLDLKILFLTLIKVAGVKDINSDENNTMDAFTGNVV
jgi:undecaprenyl phosphate N,N'-diacetylbacillosamine 1-phosphate transferase